MYNIDFQNGFMLAMALAYKREAEGNVIGSYVFKNFLESIKLSQAQLSPTDLVTLSDVFYNHLSVEDITLVDQPISEAVTLVLN